MKKIEEILPKSKNSLECVLWARLVAGLTSTMMLLCQLLLFSYWIVVQKPVQLRVWYSIHKEIIYDGSCLKTEVWLPFLLLFSELSILQVFLLCWDHITAAYSSRSWIIDTISFLILILEMESHSQFVFLSLYCDLSNVLVRWQVILEHYTEIYFVFCHVLVIRLFII